MALHSVQFVPFLPFWLLPFSSVSWPLLPVCNFAYINIFLIFFVTLRGPCRIVIYSYNKSQRDALFLKFNLIKYCTCFGQIYCPSSGVSQNCIHAIGICHTSYVDSAKWCISLAFIIRIISVCTQFHRPFFGRRPVSRLPWGLLLSTWLTFLVLSVLLTWPILFSRLILTHEPKSKSPNSSFNL